MKKIKKDHKRELLRAFIAGVEHESHWKFKWKKLPWRGKYIRIKVFLKWYHKKYKKNDNSK